MTVGDWLASRTPRPPRVLGARIDAVLGDVLRLDQSHACDALLSVAETLTAQLLARGCMAREGALDLLAADALVTYAFEAAAESPADVVPRATDAMSRLAALGSR